MDTIPHLLASVFRDSSSLMLGMLVFLAAGTLAFSVMAAVRVRGSVKRRTSRLSGEGERAANSSRSLRYSSLKAVTQLIEYTPKH